MLMFLVDLLLMEPYDADFFPDELVSHVNAMVSLNTRDEFIY